MIVGKKGRRWATRIDFNGNSDKLLGALNWNRKDSGADKMFQSSKEVFVWTATALFCLKDEIFDRLHDTERTAIETGWGNKIILKIF